jgi:hypothetical protein
MAPPSNNRQIVAHLARENKKVLFSAFSPSITKKMKEAAWEEIRVKAIAAGAHQLKEKNWAYVRDNVWAPTRRDTLAKRDKANKSGEGSVQFNEVFILN